MVEIKLTPRRQRRRDAEAPPVGAPTATVVRRHRKAAPSWTPEERHRMVETAAYFRAERRGFVPGHEADDWLAAEAEIDALIALPMRTAARRARSN